METHWPLLAACWYCSLPSNSFHRLPSLSLPPSLDLPHTDRVKSLSKARLWSNSVLCGEMQRTTVARKRLWPCSPLCLRLFFFFFLSSSHVSTLTLSEVQVRTVVAEAANSSVHCYFSSMGRRRGKVSCGQCVYSGSADVLTSKFKQQNQEQSKPVWRSCQFKVCDDNNAPTLTPRST